MKGLLLFVRFAACLAAAFIMSAGCQSGELDKARQELALTQDSLKVAEGKVEDLQSGNLALAAHLEKLLADSAKLAEAKNPVPAETGDYVNERGEVVIAPMRNTRPNPVEAEDVHRGAKPGAWSKFKKAKKG